MKNLGWALVIIHFLGACGAVGSGGEPESQCRLDSDFNAQIGSGFTGSVDELIEQPDGKLLIAGGFTALNGASREGLVRLESTGALDPGFTTAVDDSVNALALDSEGAIYLGGSFATVNATSRARLAKVDSSGALDAAFSSALGSGPDATVSSLALDSSNRLVAGGDFATVAGATASRLVRLLATGAPDTAFLGNFAPGCNLGVDVILPVAGDSLVLAGSFSTCRGTGPGRLFRLESTGASATGFNQALGTGFDNAVRAVAARPNGGYWVGGAFGVFAGAFAGNLIAVGDDGARDSDFDANRPATAINALVRALAVQSNGKLVVGGDFSKGLIRLEETGEEDVSFTGFCGTGFDGPVHAIRQLENGALLVGGDFNSFQGVAVGGLAVLR